MTKENSGSKDNVHDTILGNTRDRVASIGNIRDAGTGSSINGCCWHRLANSHEYQHETDTISAGMMSFG